MHGSCLQLTLFSLPSTQIRQGSICPFTLSFHRKSAFDFQFDSQNAPHNRRNLCVELEQRKLVDELCDRGSHLGVSDEFVDLSRIDVPHLLDGNLAPFSLKLHYDLSREAKLSQWMLKGPHALVDGLAKRQKNGSRRAPVAV